MNAGFRVQGVFQKRPGASATGVKTFIRHIKMF